MGRHVLSGKRSPLPSVATSIDHGSGSRRGLSCPALLLHTPTLAACLSGTLKHAAWSAWGDAPGMWRPASHAPRGLSTLLAPPCSPVPPRSPLASPSHKRPSWGAWAAHTTRPRVPQTHKVQRPDTTTHTDTPAPRKDSRAPHTLALTLARIENAWRAGPTTEYSALSTPPPPLRDARLAPSALSVGAIVGGPQREVVAQQLHDERRVLVALLVELVQLGDGGVEGLLGEHARLALLLVDLVEEDGVVEREAQADRVCRRELSLGDLHRLLVRVGGRVGVLLLVILGGEFSEVSVVVGLHLAVEDVRLGL
mmetsp:Transcript_8933/g.19467  ORF Transcript_8933/g.19467 Transcript_8933/m.19467 type:complete len:310 (-) Transcript_8933:383-1312(-)